MAPPAHFPARAWGGGLPNAATKAKPLRYAAMTTLRIFLFAAALLVPGAAAAQTIDTVRVRAGLSAELRPHWIGDDNSHWGVSPKFSVKTGEGPFGFGTPDDSVGIGLLDSGGLSLGPALKIQGSRKESEVGAAVGRVPVTVEAGAFAQYMIGENFRLRAEGRKGIGGHGGLVGRIGADAFSRDGDAWLVSIGPRLLLGDGKYSRAYFGVDEEAALATGLAEYRPRGGVHGYGAVATAIYRIGTSPWSLHGYARYERLTGDAADSPIIRTFGSPNQYSAGVALTHTFDIKL